MVMRQRSGAIAKGKRNKRAEGQNRTVFMRAFQSSASQLCQNTQRISVTDLETRGPGALELLSAQPELSSLPEKLREFCDVEGISRESVISIVKMGVLASEVDWSSARHLQTVHASPDIWHQPWFDNVVVRAPDGERSKEWYGQLRLLFYMGEKQLAFVRWYVETTPENSRQMDILEKYGCQSLKWETRGHGASYNVIDIQGSIIRQVYVVPDFSKGDTAGGDGVVGFFKINPWKWDRGVPKNEMWDNAPERLRAGAVAEPDEEAEEDAGEEEDGLEEDGQEE